MKNKSTKPTFKVEDFMEKFKGQKTCYLTGDPIDIYDLSSYQFDHIIPRSRGGSSDIDNLGLCTKEANYAKGNKTPEELLELCMKIVEHNKKD